MSLTKEQKDELVTSYAALALYDGEVSCATDVYGLREPSSPSPLPPISSSPSPHTLPTTNTPLTISLM